jgi:hypothetical protein
MTKRNKSWLAPTGLILLSIVPMLGGAFRLNQLASGGEVTADNARFVAAPVPVVLHIIGATVFCLLGAFQFAPGLRRRPWHRIAGRVIVPCGLVAALSGVWMNVTYDLPAHDDALLYVERMVFGLSMAAFIVVGFVAVRRRDFGGHRAWMMRAYAIGQGAGTQAVVLGSWLVVGTDPAGLTRSLLMALAWLLNLAIAEWIIRRKSARRAPAQLVLSS